MHEEDVEELLNLLQAPEPRPETGEAVMHRIRVARAIRTTAGTARAIRPFCRWFISLAAATVLLGFFGWYSLSEPLLPLAEVKGEALWVRRGASRISLKDGESLFAGDEIQTEELPRRVRLKDGSTVKLNHGAMLILDKPGAGERVRLQLKQGEIFLRVSKAPGRFCVEGSALVEVLGTVFGIGEQKGSTAVSVLSGKVSLRAAGKAIQLSRGESGSAKRGQAPQITGVDPDNSLRWARDWVRFKDKPLGTVLDWIEKNSSFRFTVSSEQRREIVTVAIADEPMLELIDALIITCGMQHRVDGNNIYVSGGH